MTVTILEVKGRELLEMVRSLVESSKTLQRDGHKETSAQYAQAGAIILEAASKLLTESAKLKD